MADILHREYFTRYIPPEVLISDNDSEFGKSAWGGGGLNVGQPRCTMHKVMVKGKGSVGHLKG